MNISTGVKSDSIFVDSNYWIALFSAGDSLNAKAESLSKDLIRYNTPLIISSLIFLEVVTIVSMRAGKSVAIEAGKHLLSNPQIQIIHIDEASWGSVWQVFQEIENKNISFVDCSILATMRAEGITTLLTFDVADFRTLQKQYRFKLYQA